MSSIIQQLQQESLDPNIHVSDLLRKAKLVATKLNLSEFLEWIDNELNGYDKGQKVPEYRVIKGEVKGWNPYHGWQPVVFKDHEQNELISQRGISPPVGELETLVNNATATDTLQVPFPADIAQTLREGIGFQTEITLIIQKSSTSGILDKVRNILLEWSLKLEEQGIVGEGISFSKSDKEKAQSITYHIGAIQNFTGNMGLMTDNAGISIQQINTINPEEIKRLIGQIKKHIPNFELNLENQAKLQSATSELDTEISKQEPEEGKVKKILGSLRSILEGASGNIIAQGVLSSIAKYLN